MCNGLAWLQFIVVAINLVGFWANRRLWKTSEKLKERYIELSQELEKQIYENMEAEKKRRGVE